MQRPYYLIFSILLFFNPEAISQIQLLENKGQYPDDFNYIGNIPGGRIFFLPDKLMYEFTSFRPHEHYDHNGLRKGTSESSDGTIKGHSYDVAFINSNPLVEISSHFPSDLTHNYFVGDKSRWASNVHDYELIKYTDLYEGISLKYYKYGETVKYDFVVDEQSDPSLIQLNLVGLDDYFLDEIGNLHLISSVSTVIETKPVAYQWIEGEKVIVNAEFKLIDNILSFNMLEEYDICHELVIDPTLIFSTYSGSTADNWGNTATFDDRGNLYSGGITSHYSGGSFPATSGAFQTTTSGFWDVAIIKYDSAGNNAVYATYLGGSQTEVPQSMVVNSDNELLIMGVTGSSNYPVANAFQNTFNGGSDIFPFGGGDNNLLFPNGSDIFVTKLNSNGSSIAASTFIGGTGNDGLMVEGDALVRNYGDQSRGDIFIKSNGNILVASKTSSVNFPLNNEFQGALLGEYDAVIFELTASLDELVFSSYLGGTGQDAAYSIKENLQGDIIVGGGTNSTDMNAQNSQFSAQSKGNVDGWVASIKANEYVLDTGMYIGTTSYDQLYFLDLDADDNIYTYGQSEGDFPIIGSVFTSGGGQFIQKWQFDLKELQASTRFGSPGNLPDISPTAFLVNDCDNIYLSGWGGQTNIGYNGGSTNNMPITSDAYQSETSGSDFYLMTLSADLSNLLYSTYLGGSQSRTHVDGGTSRFDKKGIVYHAVCAGCAGRNATGGPSSDFPTTSNAWSTTNNSSNCNNAAFKFDLATLRAIIQTNTVTLDHPGISQICFPDLIAFENLSIGGVDYEWSFGDGNTITTQDTTVIVYQYTSPGSYRVTLKVVDPNTCVGEDATALTVNVNAPLFVVQEDEVVCEGDKFILNASGGSDYFWFNQDTTFQSADRNPVIKAEQSETYYVNISDARGCNALDTVNVEVIPAIDVNFELSKIYDCFSRPSISLVNTSQESEGFLFKLGDGQTSDLDEFVYEYEKDGEYEIKLTVLNDFCAYEKLESVIINTLKVPNVFTPNGDGDNDIFEIIASSQVKLILFNRWGRKIYEEENYNNTWAAEGEPAGVYYYEAQVFLDEITCKGWVQVLK